MAATSSQNAASLTAILVDQGDHTKQRGKEPPHFQAFMDAYFTDFRTTSCYMARNGVWGMLKPLFSYLD